jgi:large subunit ribosomal protein L18Ae
VVGRALPTEKNPNPKLYRMRVFAKNPVLAKSKFWYHMKRQHKVRKVQGEIVSVSEVLKLAYQSYRYSREALLSSRLTVLC